MIPAQCEVDWGAWATFFTGCAAVAAALTVGLRQSKIQEQQAAIAARVAATEEARIRLELFEKRYEFVLTLDAFVKRVRAKREFWTDEDTAFLAGARRAEFLFPRDLKAIIDRLWNIASDYQASADAMASPIMAEREAAVEDRKNLRASLNATVEEFYELCDREIRPFDN